jgi:hypothetical protein
MRIYSPHRSMYRCRTRCLGLVFLTVGGQTVSYTENALINTLEARLAIAGVWLGRLTCTDDRQRRDIVELRRPVVKCL